MSHGGLRYLVPEELGCVHSQPSILTGFKVRVLLKDIRVEQVLDITYPSHWAWFTFLSVAKKNSTF